MKDQNLEDIFIYLIERTERQMKRYANKILNSNGIEISSEQWTILKRINEKDALNQRELADLTYKDPASVTRTLDIMEKKGWVRRMEVTNDRRSYQIELTDEGNSIVKLITPLAKKIRKKGLVDVSNSDFEVFKNTLNKIYQNYLT